MESAAVAELCQRSLKSEGGRCKFSPRLAAASSFSSELFTSSCQCQLSPATCTQSRDKEQLRTSLRTVRVSPQNSWDGYSKLSSQPRAAHRPYIPLTPSCCRCLSLRNQETVSLLKMEECRAASKDCRKLQLPLNRVQKTTDCSKKCKKKMLVKLCHKAMQEQENTLFKSLFLILLWRGEETFKYGQLHSISLKVYSYSDLDFAKALKCHNSNQIH